MSGLQDWDALRRLANGHAELRRSLKKDFAKAADDVAKKTQAKILSASTRHPGALRAQIAATVTVRGRYTQTGASAEIRADGRRMPDENRSWNLPAYANARGLWRRWRHPVYGNYDVWRQQEWPSAAGWFDDTILGEAQRFSDAVKAAMDETSRYLEGR